MEEEEEGCAKGAPRQTCMGHLEPTFYNLLASHSHSSIGKVESGIRNKNSDPGGQADWKNDDST